jgi:cyclic pyranopterin monophosphate synthase
MGRQMSSFKSKHKTAWSHLDAGNNPAMVDISAKQITQRTARAVAEVWLPPEVAAQLHDGEINAPKGPVFHTATIAGTMAAKKTSDLIPFCHTLPLDGVRIEITPSEGAVLRIEATVKATHKTGVEMEALAAATVAALTVIDMCKVFSSAMEIRRVRLLEKRGGKQDYNAAP